MTCSRCGADAAVKRESAFYCGKCAMARDWEEIIAIVQSGGDGANGVSFASAPEPAMAASSSTSATDPSELPADPFA